MLSRSIITDEKAPCYHIPTGCLELDRLLNSGIATQSVTEIYGCSGCGKTQMAIEIMLNALFSKEFEGNVIYIGTKNCLIPEVIKERISRLANLTNATVKDKELTIKKYMQKIFYKRAMNLNDFIFSVNHASETVERAYYRNPYRLVIIDSLTFFLRGVPFERTRIANELMNVMEYAARKFNCAVLITTDMSANVHASEREPLLKCMLGEEFNSRIPQRIELNRNPYNSIVCAEIKDKEDGMAFYRIDEMMGIIDLKISNNKKSEEEASKKYDKMSSKNVLRR